MAVNVTEPPLQKVVGSDGVMDTPDAWSICMFVDVEVPVPQALTPDTVKVARPVKEELKETEVVAPLPVMTPAPEGVIDHE